MTAARHCAALGLKKAPAKLIESGADMRRPNVFGDVPEGLQYLPQRAPASKVALLAKEYAPDVQVQAKRSSGHNCSLE